jgi:hypothetical protein
LYLFTADKGKSTCYGQCASYWPPLIAQKPTAGAGLKASLLGTTKATSSDYNTVKALVDGSLDSFVANKVNAMPYYRNALSYAKGTLTFPAPGRSIARRSACGCVRIRFPGADRCYKADGGGCWSLVFPIRSS